MRAEPSVAYEVDAADRITLVNSAWSVVADAAGAAHLVEARVIGRPLRDVIGDALPVLAVLDRMPPPAISHGICPVCYGAISSELDREAAPS